jgi:single-strand DNA-binding protein
MANDLNSCSFIGRLGRDPEQRFAPSGDSISNFSIAVSEQWKGKDGSKQEKTTWVRCVAFGKLSEIITEWVHKGDQIFVSGKLQIRDWEKDGQKHQTAEIVVDKMQMLGGKRDDSGESGRQTERPQAKPQGGQRDYGKASDSGNEFGDGEIPF